MKRIYSIWTVVLMLTACSNVDVTTPKLVGKWQLKTVEKNGVITPVDTVWYNFQSESVFSIQVYVPQQDTILVLEGMKKQTDDVLSIQLNSETYNNYSDWNGIYRSFTIDKLNRKSLILRSEEEYLYVFKKF
jgi:PBP1b-binding outer membrane lipoprotein LpoB